MDIGQSMRIAMVLVLVLVLDVGRDSRTHMDISRDSNGLGIGGACEHEDTENREMRHLLAYLS